VTIAAQLLLLPEAPLQTKEALLALHEVLEGLPCLPCLQPLLIWLLSGQDAWVPAGR